MENINASLQTLVVPIESLHLDDRNARTHDSKNMSAIEASYRNFGQQKPIVIDDEGRVLAGNGQLQAALNLGWKNIAAIKYSGENGTAYALADNRTGELSYWDFNVLGELIDEVDTSIIDQLHLGDFKLPDFDTKVTVDRIVQDNEPESEPEKRDDGIEVQEIVTLTLSPEAYKHWHTKVKPGIDNLSEWVMGL